MRAAEIVSALCLATDLSVGLPWEHGLHSAVVGMRLAELLGVDRETAVQTYYGCLLFYVGCTADAEVAAARFPAEDALVKHFTPAMMGSGPEVAFALVKALGNPDLAAPIRILQGVARLPAAGRGHAAHLQAMCEVAEMLSLRLGMPSTIRSLFVDLPSRWNDGGPGRRRDEIPFAVRIVQVARDATFHATLGGWQHAVNVIQDRSGKAFDPAVAAAFVQHPEILDAVRGGSMWPLALDHEPYPFMLLRDTAIDDAVAAMGDFADLVAPTLVGHSSGVAEIAAGAATRCGLDQRQVAALRRAAHLHDVGRVAVPARIWQKPGPLTPAEWERVRLHPYHSERILAASAFLRPLGEIAGLHHERLDGSGYHRGARGEALDPIARMLAAADAFHTITEPRPHRAALTTADAATEVTRQAAAGLLDPTCVAAVIEAAGQPAPKLARPAGLTEREVEVVALLARGLQTKQIGRVLGITPKTADHHIQHLYAKIGVSTRAAAAVYAMAHGLTMWGELPMAHSAESS